MFLKMLESLKNNVVLNINDKTFTTTSLKFNLYENQYGYNLQFIDCYPVLEENDILTLEINNEKILDSIKIIKTKISHEDNITEIFIWKEF